MKRINIIIIVVIISMLFVIAGSTRNDVVEIHNHGAAMCMACIGLE